MTLIRTIRARIMRIVRQKDAYLKGKSLKPISFKYGYDRGKPVDRYYMEQFLAEHASDVKGHCLEVVDPAYTIMFGGTKVTKSDVLDIIKRKTTTIHDDLRKLTKIKDNTYDCFILTQTLNVIDEYEAAIKESFRILKPGGVLLVTLPTLSPCWNLRINFWRITKKGAEYLFGKHFGKDNVTVSSYGNLESAQAFWVGFSQSDINVETPQRSNDSFPLIIGIRAVKK